MGDFFEFFSNQFPAFAVIAVILFICWLLLREYSKFRLDLLGEVEKTVNSYIGTAISKVTLIETQLESRDKNSAIRLEEITKRADDFLRDISEKETLFHSLNKNVPSQLGDVEKIVADVDEDSAGEIVYLASAARTSREKAHLCRKLLDHEDPTSRDLESAGDIARNIKRNSLALRLYQKSVDVDPERRQALIELNALKAELSFTDRDESLTNMTSAVMSGPTSIGIARACNVFIEIDRYPALQKFCEDLLSLVNDDSKTKVMALRNLAVAMHQQGKSDESRARFQEALAINPHDENVLKAYLSILNSHADDKEFEKVACRLVDSDPTSISHLFILIGHYIKVKDLKKAELCIEEASDLGVDGRDGYVLAQHVRKLQIMTRKMTNVARV